jgi:hypothetical protein
MCIACELGFWSMVDALPKEARERILREQAARFACEAPGGEPRPTPQPTADESKKVVTSRE